MPKEECIATLKEAIAAGVTLFDTAEAYNVTLTVDNNEQLLGEVGGWAVTPQAPQLYVPGARLCGAAANDEREAAFDEHCCANCSRPWCAGEAIKGIPRDQVVIATKWGEALWWQCQWQAAACGGWGH